MRATFMAYVETLIGWADDLFGQDARESVTEAAQLYVHALQLLGPQPHLAADPADPTVGSTVMQQLGEGPVFGAVPRLAQGTVTPDTRRESTAFFDFFGSGCLPPNDKLLDYWSTISDRLFKIRHCMNIDGTVRSLPLLQPPIDPALLVRAAAAGVDIGAAVAGLNAPRPHYRFSFISQKALDFAGEVRSLGSTLLSALEKRDAEGMQILRAGHERAMADRMRDLRREQVAEAEASIAAIDRAISAATEREQHYRGLVSAKNLMEEKAEDGLTIAAMTSEVIGQGLNSLGAAVAPVPQSGMMGPIPVIYLVDGKNLSGTFAALGGAASGLGAALRILAHLAGTTGRRKRREQEWTLQARQARRDVERLEKDRIAAEIRVAMSELELSNQDKAIENTAEAERFLKDKFTNAQLYGWMVTELGKLHHQAYQMAVDLARQAEQCYRHEFGRTDTSFIGAAHWDSLRKGLLSGDRLAQDIRRMDAAYLAENERRFELRKSVSLLRLDPVALMTLRGGRPASFDLPEWLFDLDHPDHYDRRIKSVSLTIPAVAGPQTSISCEFQLNTSVRRMRGDHADTPQHPPETHGARIATSGGQTDAGLFQLDFRDERYLPFEGAGAVSNWTLRLPEKDIAQFDYASISDVILTVQYTAKGDETMRAPALSRLSQNGAAILPDRLSLLFSLRHDFPGEWARIAGDETRATADLALVREHMPYVWSLAAPSVTGVQVVPLPVEGAPPDFADTPTARQAGLPGTVEIDLDPTTAEGIRDGTLHDVTVLVHLSS